MKRNRWLIFWLLGMTLDAGTTLIGQMQSRNYEQNGVVSVVGFKLTYLLMAGLAIVIVWTVPKIEGAKARGVASAFLVLVGTSRWVAGTVAGLSLMGVLR